MSEFVEQGIRFVCTEQSGLSGCRFGKVAYHGNPTQWPAGYPGAARLTAEIDRGVCHVVTGVGEIQAVFCLIPGDEPTYRIMEDGAWPEDLPYATIHRMASAGIGYAS